MDNKIKMPQIMLTEISLMNNDNKRQISDWDSLSNCIMVNVKCIALVIHILIGGACARSKFEGIFVFNLHNNSSTLSRKPVNWWTMRQILSAECTGFQVNLFFDTCIGNCINNVHKNRFRSFFFGGGGGRGGIHIIMSLVMNNNHYKLH